MSINLLRVDSPRYGDTGAYQRRVEFEYLSPQTEDGQPRRHVVDIYEPSYFDTVRRLGCSWPERETRSQFETLAREGLVWLEEELVLARPRLVITLGAGVAGVLQDVRGPEASEALLGGELQDVWLGESVYPALHLGVPKPGHVKAIREVVARLAGWAVGCLVTVWQFLGSSLSRKGRQFIGLVGELKVKIGRYKNWTFDN